MSTVLCLGYVTIKVDVAHSTVLTCTKVGEMTTISHATAERHYTNALSSPSDVAFHRHHPSKHTGWRFSIVNPSTAEGGSDKETAQRGKHAHFFLPDESVGRAPRCKTGVCKRPR